MKIKCGHCFKIGEALELATYARYKCAHCNKVNEVTNIELHEWLGFQYTQFLQSIEKFITKDQYENLKANNEIERIAGYLSEGEINQLKSILKVSFKEGLSIRDITKKIRNEIAIKDLREIKDGQVTDKVVASASIRPLMIARTESTRAAYQGSLLNYKDNGIQEVAWLASTGERTCDYCLSQNGIIMSITEANGKIPAHPYCRCAGIPVVKS